MELKEIDRANLIPSEWNPRSSFDEEKLKLLRESINGIGLVEPLVVRPHPTQKGKYLITAGERRWQSKPNGKFLCIVRDESELNSKVACLVENYVRENIDDKDHEKFIFNIFKEGIKAKKWGTYNDMKKKTGIPEYLIKDNVGAHTDRKEIGMLLNVSTIDILDSKRLKNKPNIRRKLLEKRANGKISGEGHIIRDWSRALDILPEEKALEVVEIARELNDVKVAVEIHQGKRPKGIFSENDGSLTRVGRVEMRCESIWDITPAFLEMIDNRGDRKKALEFLKKTYDHLHNLLMAMNEIEVVDIESESLDKKEV